MTRLDFRRGEVARALRREHALLAVLGAPGNNDPADATVVATVLADRAWRAASRGAWGAASDLLVTAQSALIRCAGGNRIAAIDCDILKSHVALSRSGDLVGAEAAATRALRHAQRDGFARRAAVAGVQLADVQYRMGWREQGIATARASVEVARQVDSAAILAGAALGAAHLELMSQRADDAVPYLDLAAGNIVEGSSYWTRLQLAWADVVFQRGALEDALSYAVAGRDAAERTGNLRLHGAALRRCALIEHELGHENAALRTIQRALDELRRHGTRYALALGYETLFRVTGRAADLQQARDLLAPTLAG